MLDENKMGGGPYRGYDPSPETDDGPVEAEYHYVRPKFGHECVDAGYIPKNEAPAIPRLRYTEPENIKIKKEKRHKSGGGFVRLVAACLICALLGGLTGGGLVAYYGGFTAEPDMSASDNPGQQGVNTPAPAPIVSDGRALTGSQIYELGCPQTVGITTEVTTRNIFGQISTGSVAGSGFIIRTDGYIVTNYHVIEAAYQNGYAVKVILYNGEEYEADIVGTEEDNDVAVLKIDAENLSAVSVGDSGSMLVGDAVYAIGNPLGELTYTMTTGSISALDREISAESQYKTINMFQIDAAVNSGNSGGPVFNSRGEVIGIVTAKYQSTGVEGLGFAIPINDAIGIANSIIEHGYVTGKAYFGITPSDVNSAAAAYYNMVEGVFVKGIEAGSCAETAGLKIGDIITKLGDTEIKSSTDLMNAKRDYRAGDPAVVTVYRDGDYLELTLIFDEEPSPASAPETSPDVEPVPENEQGAQTPGDGWFSLIPGRD